MPPHFSLNIPSFLIVLHTPVSRRTMVLRRSLARLPPNKRTRVNVRVYGLS